MEKAGDEIDNVEDDHTFPPFFFLVFGEFLVREGLRIFLFLFLFIRPVVILHGQSSLSLNILQAAQDLAERLLIRVRGFLPSAAEE
jgi:hypothetical protein